MRLDAELPANVQACLGIGSRITALLSFSSVSLVWITEFPGNLRLLVLCLNKVV